jgi:hypothetical protein
VYGRGRGGNGGGGHNAWQTTSMGIIFVPFAIGVFSLFADASRKWAWWLTHIGLAIIAAEMLSRVRFFMQLKTTHFLLMLILFLFGCALMFKSYRPLAAGPDSDSPERDGEV